MEAKQHTTELNRVKEEIKKENLKILDVNENENKYSKTQGT